MRFWIAAFFSLLSFFAPTDILKAIFATPVVLWAGSFFYTEGIKSLNMFTLISLSVATAYIYSMIAVFTGSHLLYFEAATGITTLVLLGQVFERRATKKTHAAIQKLLSLSPKFATILVAGQEQEVAIDAIKKGDLIRVRPGQQVAVDGTVIEGKSWVDESMLTGEAFAVEKLAGSKVTGGTLNTTGSFIMQADAVGDATILSRIIHLVESAETSKAPIQRLADLVAAYFVPFVAFVAFFTFIIWYLFGPEPTTAFAVNNMVAVLIIACPCAFGLATPMSITVGIGRGASLGVLIKDAKSLELLSKVDTVVIDKTGTLTEGKIEVTDIVALKPDVLQMAASLEALSEHPLSKAIVAKTTDKLLPVEQFEALPGKGIKGTIQGRSLFIGNKVLMQELGITHLPFNATLYYVEDGVLQGGFTVEDRIKASSFQAVQALKKMKIHVIMLTGDSKQKAQEVADELGIHEVHSEVLPDEKNSLIQSLQKKGHIVAMAGDGINDSPALAQADVGIAMGTGSDIAIESAPVTLLKGDIGGILHAILLSQATVKNIKQNLFLAFIYNILCIPIAAGILYPSFGILLNPVIACAAMALSDVTVVYNALRLRYCKLSEGLA